MAILRERQVWRRDEPPRTSARPDRLTVEQEAHLRAVLKVLYVRHGGSWRAVARALNVFCKSVERIMRGYRRPTAGLAIRVAELVGVPVDDVLTGAFPKPGACPMCGRAD